MKRAPGSNRGDHPFLPFFDQFDQARCLLERTMRTVQGALELATFLGYSPKVFNCTKSVSYLNDFRAFLFACDLPITLARSTKASELSMLETIKAYCSFTVDTALFASFWQDQLPRAISSLGVNGHKLPTFPGANFLASYLDPFLTAVYFLDICKNTQRYKKKSSYENILSLFNSLTDFISLTLPDKMPLMQGKPGEALFNCITGVVGSYTIWKTFPKTA